MKLLLPLTCVLAAVLGCAKPQASEPSKPDNTPIKHLDRSVANTAVKDPKARYLGEASAYLINLFESDQTMAEAFVRDDRDAKSILQAIRQAHEQEQKDWRNLETPTKSYSNIAAKLSNIHRDHEAAWTLYVNVFLAKDSAKMENMIDKADAILKKSLADLDSTKDLVKAAMERDVEQ